LVAPQYFNHNAKDNLPFLDALAKAHDIAMGLVLPERPGNHRGD
jgi:hypothetical protein